MTDYFVTAPTTLLGTHIIASLLQRSDCTRVYAFARTASFEHAEQQWLDEARVIPLAGDLDAPGLGFGEGLPERIDHVVHLSARGIENVLTFAGHAGASAVHQLSHGPGGAEPLSDQSGPHVREYRASVMLGDSCTGEPVGEGAALGVISRLARLPVRLPLVVPDMGATSVVPVDYVAAAMTYLMHRDAPPGTVYRLAGPETLAVKEIYNAFAEAAGAPRIVATAPKIVSKVVAVLTDAVMRRAARGLRNRAACPGVLAELGMAGSILPRREQTDIGEDLATQQALAGSGLTAPPLRDYAEKIYRYWATYTDPDRAHRGHGGPALDGRTVLITGASSGIGRHTALKVAREGAIVLLVARRSEGLTELVADIEAAGGQAAAYPCDLTDSDAVQDLVKQVLAEHAVDVLVNNAGRSIRRAIADATDRMHDYERTMAINYFAPVRLTLELLPHMLDRRHGHVVNITTQGLQNHTPRFSAYLASKAALEEFGLVYSRELLSYGVTCSSVKLPLVSTEMTAPSEKFNAFGRLPLMNVERAASLVHKAIVRKPETVELFLPAGIPAVMASRLAPRTTRALAHVIGYESMPARPGQPSGLAGPVAAVVRMLWRRL